MFKKTVLFSLAFLMFFVLTAFQVEARPLQTASSEPTIYEGVEGEVIDNYQSYVYTLWAGQNHEAGSLIIYNDEYTLFLDFATEGLMKEIHVYLYNDIESLPSMRPAPGLAPYSLEDIYDHTASLSIPMDEALEDGDTFYLIVHVAFTALDGETDETILWFAEETAYAAGEDEPVWSGRGAWFYIIGFTVKYIEDDNGEDPGDMTSQTVWAYGGDYALPNWDYVSVQNWGWTNGPLDEGSYLFDLYAGAALNDLAKGTWVGTLSVEYDNGTVTVTYHVDPDFILEEIQLHVGNEVLPRNQQDNFTAAPGLFPIKDENVMSNTLEFVIEDMEGMIYVSAHAVVRGYFPTE